MRSLRRLTVLSFALGLVAAFAPGEETVRTVRAELSGQDLSSFAVENLVGTMRISAGTGDKVTVVATVYAESSALADAVRIERVTGEAGAATLRVRYPYNKISTFRYREPGNDTDGFFLGFVSSSTYDYDGRNVRVSPGHGTRLHADLEIQVPPGRLRGSFRNLVGLVEAEGIQGRLHFGVESADLHLRRLEGEISLEGSSGDTRARDIKGVWKSDFSSGDCVLDGFEGEALALNTSSGDLVLKHVRARKVAIETSSGDARLSDADIEQFTAEATSGDISLQSAGSRLQEVRITTSSGDVSLRLPVDAAFEADASQSSGDMTVRFSDGTDVRHRDTLVGYRHGKGGARIHVRTSSGDLSISPG